MALDSTTFEITVLFDNELNTVEEVQELVVKTISARTPLLETTSEGKPRIKITYYPIMP